MDVPSSADAGDLGDEQVDELDADERGDEAAEAVDGRLRRSIEAADDGR